MVRQFAAWQSRPAARRPRFDYDLINIGELRRLKHRLRLRRQGTPCLGELGLHRGAQDVGEINDRQPRLFEQDLHVLDCEKADMGAVEQAPIPIMEVASQQTAQDRRMGHMRQRYDDATVRVQQARGMPKGSLGIAKVFQDVRDDDGVKPGIAEGVRPGWIVEVPLDHTVAKLREDPDARGINLERSELGVVVFHKRPGDGARPGTDLQHVLSQTHEAQNVGSRSVRGGIYAVAVCVRSGFGWHIIPF